MTNHSHTKLRELFLQAVELESGAARRELLQRECGDDAALMAQLEGMLKAFDDPRAKDFLEQPLVPAGEWGEEESPQAAHVPSDQHHSEWQGQLIDDRYRVSYLLGKGGMAEVYLAVDTRTGGNVVVKSPLPGLLLDDPGLKVRFMREIRAMSSLSHPHVVRVSDVVEHDGRPLAVIQYVDGGNLDQRNDLPVSDWLPQIASALDYVHSRQLVHRDVKPPNIFFDTHQTPYLGDFGIVKCLDNASSMAPLTQYRTQSGYAFGTPRYMSPEAVEGKTLSAASDQYALAIIVYEQLAGRIPFDAETPAKIIAAHLMSPPQWLSDVDGQFSVETSEVLDRALSKKPDDRFDSCRDFADALLRSQVDTPVNAADSSALDPTTEHQGTGAIAAASTGTATNSQQHESPAISRSESQDSEQANIPVVSQPWYQRSAVLFSSLTGVILAAAALAALILIPAMFTMSAFDRIPAHAIESDLGFTVFVRHQPGDSFWEEIGSTPGTVDVPACAERLFEPASLSLDTVESYANELARLQVRQIKFSPLTQHTGNLSDLVLRLLDHGDHVVHGIQFGEIQTVGDGIRPGLFGKFNFSFLREVPRIRALGFPATLSRKELSQLASLGILTNLTSLDVSGCRNLADIGILEHLTNLTSLSLAGCENLTNVDSLKGLTNLTSLNLSHCNNLTNVDVLQGMTNLTSLNLSSNRKLTNVDSLKGLTSLTSLHLSQCNNLTNLNGLKELTELTLLDLNNCENLTEVDGLKDLTNLASLDLTNCHNLTDVDALHELGNLTSLDLSSCEKLSNVDALNRLGNLTSLDLSFCRNLTNVDFLRAMTNLTSLNLVACENLTNLNGLNELTHLTSFDLSSSHKLTNVDSLKGLVNLESLKLTHCPNLANLNGLKELTKLTSLNLSHCENLTEIDTLHGLANLESLDLSWCENLSNVDGLKGLANLNSLELSECFGLTNLDGLKGLTNLASLNLNQCNRLTHVDALKRLVNLTSLDLSWCENLSNVDGLKGLTNLTSLDLSNCPKLTDVDVLKELPNLRSLRLFNCSILTNVDCLKGLTTLTSLELPQCENLSDINGLRGLTNLKSLDLSNCHELTELEVLKDLPNLTSLTLINCNSLTDVDGLKDLTNLAQLNLWSCDNLTNIDGLEYLTNLTVLTLSDCDKIANVDVLQGLKGLIFLHLQDCNKLTSRDIEVLKKQLPHCTIVH